MADINVSLNVKEDNLSPLLEITAEKVDELIQKARSVTLGGDGGMGGGNYGPMGTAGAYPTGPVSGGAAGAARQSARASYPSAPSASPSFSTPPLWGPGGANTMPSGFPGSPAGGGAGGGFPPPGGAAAAAGQAGGSGGNVPPFGNPGYYPPQPNSNVPQPNPNATGWTDRQKQIAGVAIGGLAVRDISQGIGLYASNTASGDYDPMTGAALFGGAFGAAGGAVVGALLSPLEPGTGAAVGMLAGQMLGAASLQAVIAPLVRQRNSEIILQSIAAREGESLRTLVGATVDGGVPLFPRSDKYGHPIYTDRSRHIAGELDSLQESISFSGKSAAQILGIKAGVYAGRDIISLQQISQTYSTLGSGLLAAGDDPDEALSMTDRLARRYYMGAPAMANRAARGAAIRNRTGRNDTDLLLGVGPEDYGAYTDATPGMKDITGAQRAAYGDFQRRQYQADRAGNLTRGSGAAQETAYKAAMDDLALLPDGRDSAAYGQANQGRIGARELRYSQEDMPYHMKMLSIEGEQERSRYLPYSPGYQPRVAVEAIALRSSHINRDIARYNDDAAHDGFANEQDRLQRASMIQAERTAQARDIGVLSLGGEDRQIALSAGRPDYFSRMDSESLAATSIMRGGRNWNRGHGAVNGHQKAMQDSWLRDAAGPDFDASLLGPQSRTSDMNSSLQVVGVLKQILAALQSNGVSVGGGARAGEARGNRAAMDASSSVDPKALYGKAG